MDPVYPVLRTIIGWLELTPEEALRLAVLYVAFYDLQSALTVWLKVGWPDPMPEEYWRLPTGTERRAHRDPRQFRAHMEAVQARIDSYSSLTTWADQAGGDWRTLQSLLANVRGNGRWAAYKTGEVMKTVLGWPLTPTDAGHEFSTGPRKGLVMVYPEAATASVTDLDKMTEELRQELAGWKVPMPVEQLETVLCDWHSTVEGRYYVGHDIDLMLQQVRPGPAGDLIVEARYESFHPQWLGEVQGWDGVRPELRRLYRDEGRIEWW